MMLRVITLGAALLWSTSAYAQSGPGTGNPENGEPVVKVCNVSGDRPVCPPDYSRFENVWQYYVPLSQFASAANLNAMAADLSALRQSVDNQSRFAHRSMSAGVAMASSLDFQGPAEGANNRLGAGVATFNDETGLGVTYTHRAGRWDTNVGFATSEYDHLAKASVGLSW